MSSLSFMNFFVACHKKSFFGYFAPSKKYMQEFWPMTIFWHYKTTFRPFCFIYESTLHHLNYFWTFWTNLAPFYSSSSYLWPKLWLNAIFFHFLNDFEMQPSEVSILVKTWLKWVLDYQFEKISSVTLGQIEFFLVSGRNVCMKCSIKHMSLDKALL